MSVQNQVGAAPITTAIVIVNGVQLSYAQESQDFYGEINLSPGVPLFLSVTVDGVNYAASMNQFRSYPSIITPVANAIWVVAPPADSTWTPLPLFEIDWSSTESRSTSNFVLGLFDASGKLVWPSDGGMLVLPNDQYNYSLNASNLGVGDDVLLVGIVDSVSVGGAALGSSLIVGGFNYVPITISATPKEITLQDLAISFSNENVTNFAVGVNRTGQLSVVGSYSDGSKVDLTAQVVWSSSDPTTVAIDSIGQITGVSAGRAVVTAQLNGSVASMQITAFQSNPSPIPPLSQSVTYQIDYGHSGRATVGGTGPIFPPSAAWSTTLNGNVSYPLIAEGKVFVLTDASSETSGTSLYALDETSGRIVWGPVSMGGFYSWAGHAYDHGKVFVVNFDGALRSFDAATGLAVWSEQLGQYAFSSPPTAVDGVIYIGGAGSSGTLYAVDELTGEFLWTATVANGDHSSPAVSADGVFVSYPCQAYKFDPLSGALRWRYNGPCQGGGGKTSAFGDGHLYVRDPVNLPNRIFDASSGAQVGTFDSTTIPALSGQAAYYLYNGVLSSVDTATQNTNWTFSGDGGLQVAPIVIDSVVVVGSTTGTVYALDASTGSTVWSGSAGAGIFGPDEQNATRPLVGLGTGDGYLVVPAGKVVTGWKIIP